MFQEETINMCHILNCILRVFGTGLLVLLDRTEERCLETTQKD